MLLTMQPKLDLLIVMPGCDTSNAFFVYELAIRVGSVCDICMMQMEGRSDNVTKEE